ncbi:MAG TPA: TIGR02996 domain-containing protein [Pirellulales bacterium]
MSSSPTDRQTYLVPVNPETIDALASGVQPEDLAIGIEPDLSTLQLSSPPVWSANEVGGREVNHILYSDDSGIWTWWGVDESDMAAMMAIYTAGLMPGKPYVEFEEVFPLKRTPEESALLDAIVAAPDDDAPRLAYADYLTAQGDLRGEVIRLQIEMERCEDTDEERCAALWDEAQKLLDAHGREWFRPLAALNLWPTLGSEFCPEFFMQRGMLEAVWIHLEDVLPEHAEELWSFAPTLNSVSFFQTVDLPGLAALPQMQRIQELSVLANEPETAESDMAALAESPNVTRLRSLTLGYELSDPAAMTLFSAPWFDRLRELDLQRAKLSPEMIEMLTARSTFVELDSLDLGGPNMTEQSAVNLSENPALRNLISLRLGEAPLSGAAFRELVLGAWPRLQCLDLGACVLTEDDVEFLAYQPSLPALEYLNLQGCAIGERGAAALAGSPYLQRIKSLDVDRSAINEDELIVLASRFGESLKVHE